MVSLVFATAAAAGVLIRFGATMAENARMLATARHEAITDSLTGLGNRRRLLDDLARVLQAATPERPAALLLFDLNGFKGYNDTFGHQAGDSLLSNLATQLESSVHGQGRAYRLGGDEFCVLVPDAGAQRDECFARAARALSAQGQGFSVTAAQGMVLVPAEADTASEVLRLADRRMYRDKGTARPRSGLDVLGALQQTLHERDPNSDAHVAGLAAKVAETLGLGRLDVERTHLAAILHDIGKVAVPDRILAKGGPLDQIEWEMMRRHPAVGARILEASSALSDVAPLVAASHERVDGCGYPAGLQGAEIPLGARIVAVCDAYSAMTSDRPYRQAISQQEAVTELRRCAGAQFDVMVVDAFVAALVAEPNRHAAEAERNLSSARVSDS